MGSGISVRARRQDHEIGLRLAICVETQGILNAGVEKAVSDGAGKSLPKPPREGGVRTADRIHVKNVSVDQLDPDGTGQTDVVQAKPRFGPD
jgi:hypothetical protein